MMLCVERHRGDVGGALLVSAVACWIAAVPVATAPGSSWTSSTSIGLLAGGLLCAVAALWAFGFWAYVVGVLSAATKRGTAASASVETSVVLADRSLQTIRNQAGVRPMLSEENDLPLGELPAGIYGFAVPWAVGPGFSPEHQTLSSTGGGTAAAELHKRADGALALAGYLTADEVVALRNPSRQTRLDVVLRLEPDPTRMAVSIPLGLVAGARDRQVEHSYVLDLRLKPVAQD
jgi:hypothetical protein